MFDYTKDSKQLLVELINSDNGLSLAPSLVVFGLPTATTGENPTRNTTINVSGAQGSGYVGNKDVTYDRVPASGFIGTVNLTFVKGDAQNLSEFLPEINAVLKTNILPADVVDAAVPEFGTEPNEIQPVSLSISADSLVYMGAVPFNISNGELDLSALITVTELAGFTIDPSQVVDETPTDDGWWTAQAGTPVLVDTGNAQWRIKRGDALKAQSSNAGNTTNRVFTAVRADSSAPTPDSIFGATITFSNSETLAISAAIESNQWTSVVTDAQINGRAIDVITFQGIDGNDTAEYLFNLNVQS
ncbi:hypothetical protein ACLPJK_25705 [Pseudomonas aeruginosa]|uniref:DUF7941 domain-family protein n=1 Tax=Pseudomonas aeruginosa TaxID=287 RepID=UPI003D273DDD